VRRNRSTATIADVAEQAGVGASTVSRVLNDGDEEVEPREERLELD
jgi:DNA-binding LacI/PurR family transcriptional regulator